MAIRPRHRDQAAMKNLLSILSALLLGACASTPPVPDWQANAFTALKSSTSAYLEGNTRVADFEFARAKSEVAKTGRVDLMAKIELVRCAAQVASLALQPCAAYQALATEAQPAEQAYAAFIAGRWTGLNPALLPPAYQALVAQAQQVQPHISSLPLAQIQDPLSRLLVASLLLQKELLALEDIGLAVKIASNQGWRRPLLGWLGVQLKRHQTVGNAAAAQRIKQRIELVLQATP